MTAELWQQLSELCSRAIPDEYHALLQNFPAPLKTAVRAEDGSTAEGFVADVELLADLECVIAINREARSGPILDPDGEEFAWPQQLLVIGETGSGDYFCLDTSGEYPGVVQYLHQEIDFDVVAESLQDYVNLLLDAFVAGEPTDPAEF